MPKRVKKTPSEPIFSFKACYSGGLFPIMNFFEHEDLIDLSQKQRIDFTTEIPSFNNEKEFKKYVIECRDFLGIYISEKKEARNKLDGYLKEISDFNKAKLEKKERLEEEKLDKPQKSQAHKKLVSELLNVGIASMMYKVHFLELVFNALMNKDIYKAIINYNFAKVHLMMKAICYLNI